jgi:hypothetical protein
MRQVKTLAARTFPAHRKNGATTTSANTRAGAAIGAPTASRATSQPGNAERSIAAWGAETVGLGRAPAAPN